MASKNKSKPQSRPAERPRLLRGRAHHGGNNQQSDPFTLTMPEPPSGAVRQSNRGRNYSTNRRSTAPHTNNTNNGLQKLIPLSSKITALGAEILTMITDNLARTELDQPSALLLDPTRTRLTRNIQNGLKLSRKYESRQTELMKQLLALRATLPSPALVKFYMNKEELAKQHSELKGFSRFCESRLQLIRIYDTLGDNIDRIKKRYGLKNLHFSDFTEQNHDNTADSNENENMEESVGIQVVEHEACEPSILDDDENVKDALLL